MIIMNILLIKKTILLNRVFIYKVNYAGLITALGTAAWIPANHSGMVMYELIML